MPERQLTKQEAKMIAEAMVEVFQNKMYWNAGKGLFNWAWKGLICVLIFAAGYGVSHGWLG